VDGAEDAEDAGDAGRHHHHLGLIGTECCTMAWNVGQIARTGVANALGVARVCVAKLEIRGMVAMGSTVV